MSSALFIFQSTSLSRGKTVVHSDFCFRMGSFNPLPSHEGRLASLIAAERASFFQSTSLSRGKTDLNRLLLLKGVLSIHFPLTREDTASAATATRLLSFNPLPSHEGRLEVNIFLMTRRPPFNPLPSHEGRRPLLPSFLQTSHFQSTSLSRGKTGCRII